MGEKPCVRERVDEAMADLADCLDGLDKFDLTLVNDMLRDFLWYNFKVLDLQEEIDEEGDVLTIYKGAADNRHKEMVENPKVKVIHKYSQRKGDCFNRVMQKLKAVGNMEAQDALEAFNAGR